LLVADTITEPQLNEPAPTEIILSSPLPVPDPIEISLVTLRLFDPEIVIVLERLPPLIVRLAQTAAVLTVTLKLFGITTACPESGTRFSDQFEAVFQFELEEPSHVFVWADKLPETIRKARKRIQLLVRVLNV